MQNLQNNTISLSILMNGHQKDIEGEQNTILSYVIICVEQQIPNEWGKRESWKKPLSEALQLLLEWTNWEQSQSCPCSTYFPSFKKKSSDGFSNEVVVLLGWSGGRKQALGNEQRHMIRPGWGFGCFYLLGTVSGCLNVGLDIQDICLQPAPESTRAGKAGARISYILARRVSAALQDYLEERERIIPLSGHENAFPLHAEPQAYRSQCWESS